MWGGGGGGRAAAPPKPRGSCGTPQPIPRWELCLHRKRARSRPRPAGFLQGGVRQGHLPPPPPASPSSRLEVHGAARLPLVNWMRRARPWGNSVTCCGLDVGRGPRGAGGWRRVPTTGEQTQPPAHARAAAWCLRMSSPRSGIPWAGRWRGSCHVTQERRRTLDRSVAGVYPCNKAPQMGWFTQQTSAASWVWRQKPKVCVSAGLVPSGAVRANLSPACPRAATLVSLGS